MILAVDNGSLYTPALIRCLQESGTPCEVRRFDEAGDASAYSGYVLSGRRSNNGAMNAANSGIIRHALDSGKPLLGICYGAELLALVTGGTIRRMAAPVRGPESVTATRKNPLCSGSVEVYESHSYEIARMSEPMVRLAGSATCRNEIIRHGDAHVFGVQFHPEMTAGGRDMIRRFLEL